MNLAAFAVIVVRERETPFGDDIRAVEGLGGERPVLAWPLTISMLALAGLPGTTGFIGKLFLIEAAVEGDYTWLGVAIVVGTMISLAYYLRVVAAVWMRPAAEPGPGEEVPAIAGGAPEADGIPSDEPRGTRCVLILTPMIIVAAATVVLGIYPDPLVDWAANAGESLGSVL
jgi:NADH-quinone oxidoreductase subunit N